MQFYEINICEVMIFRLYTINNKHEMIKIGIMKTEKNRKGSNKFDTNCIISSDCFFSRNQIIHSIILKPTHIRTFMFLILNSY